MLTIRNEQMAIFKRMALQRFEDQLFASIQEFWPQRCTELGADEVRNIIRRGLEIAGRYGILSQRHLFRFINLMFFAGFELDTDPAHTWAQTILTDSLLTEREKLDHLVEKARSHADKR